MSKTVQIDWKLCRKCDLHKTRKNVVLGAGSAPADVLFIGEAPGKSEDLLGMPFIGPAGKLLSAMIDMALQWSSLGTKPRIYITNACACRPTDSPLGENRQPTGDELWACYQRLEWECKQIARPKVVVFLGKVADAAARKLFPSATALQHPAYILRQGGIGSPPAIKFIRELAAVFQNLAEEYADETDAEARSQHDGIRSQQGGDAVHASNIHAMPCRMQAVVGSMAERSTRKGNGVRKPLPRAASKVVRRFVP